MVIMFRPETMVSAGSLRSAARAEASSPSTPTLFANARPTCSPEGGPPGAWPLTRRPGLMLPRPPPDSTIALWNSPLAAGVVIRVWIENPPADSPKMVTFPGSPPKAPMFRCTHLRAAIWSMKP